MPEPIVGAIDLGGTKILSAVLGHAGKILGSDRRSTGAGGPGPVIDRMAASLQHACADAGVPIEQLCGVGISAAGPIDSRTGILSNPPNLPGWTDVPLARLLSERLGRDVLLENDANAAALGEHAFGAGRGTSHMLYITISTGIGGGIIISGDLYRGASGGAGEIGHIIIQPGGPRCGCGQLGCLEALASGTAIAREGRQAVAEGRSLLLRDLSRKDEGLGAEDVTSAAQQGDPVACQILTNAATALGIGYVALVHLFNPERIVIGGGASKIGSLLLDPAEAYMRAHAFPRMAGAVQLAAAQHTDEAGVLGAAALMLRAVPVD